MSVRVEVLKIYKQNLSGTLIQKEISPRDSTCRKCSKIIKAKSQRIKFYDCDSRFSVTRFYHLKCCPKSLLRKRKFNEKEVKKIVNHEFSVLPPEMQAARKLFYNLQVNSKDFLKNKKKMNYSESMFSRICNALKEVEQNSTYFDY